MLHPPHLQNPSEAGNTIYYIYIYVYTYIFYAHTRRNEVRQLKKKKRKEKHVSQNVGRRNMDELMVELSCYLKEDINRLIARSVDGQLDGQIDKKHRLLD